MSRSRKAKAEVIDVSSEEEDERKRSDSEAEEFESESDDSDTELDESDDEDDAPKKRKGAAKKSAPTKKAKEPKATKGAAAAKSTKAAAAGKGTKAATKSSSKSTATGSSDAVSELGSKRKSTETAAAAATRGPVGTSYSLSAGGSSAGSGAAAAAAGGKKVKRELTGKEAEDEILRYMTDQNRPYAALQVFDNLHETIKKPLVIRIMDQLTDQGKLVGKLFGKAKIYHVNQDNLPSADPAAIAELDAAIEEASQRLSKAKETQQQLQTEVSLLESGPTTAAAIEQIAKLKQQIESKSARLAAIEASAGEIKSKDVDRLKARFAEVLKEWRKRSRACMEMVNMALESSGTSKTPKAWMRDQGLETDEEYKADIKAYLQLAEEMGVAIKK